MVNISFLISMCARRETHDRYEAEISQTLSFEYKIYDTLTLRY